MYYGGYQGGYGYGGGSCGCGGNTGYYPMYNCGCGGGFGYNAAIILVLFILLVIIIGTRTFTA